MRHYLTADWHLNHEFVAQLRGFEDTADHDEYVLDNAGSVLKKDDHLWILGDLNLRDTTDALTKVHGLPGVKHLILGNHDAAHPMHRRSAKNFARYMHVFETVGIMDELRMGDERVLLSHFPYSGDHHGTADRHNQWRPRDYGQKLVHGHVHADALFTGEDMNGLNVGMDWFPRPVSLEAAIDMLNMDPTHRELMYK